MNDLEMTTQPIALFRTNLLSAVSSMLQGKPLGFRIGDVGTAMGVPLNTINKRSIRHQLDRMADIGQLDRVSRGLYIAGEHAASIGESDLASAIGVAFRDAGGVLAMDNLLANLPHALSNRRAVLAYLAADDRFLTHVPIPGMTRHWVLQADLRHRIPLAGGLQLLELRLLRMSQGALPTSWGIDALHALRRRIAQGLEDARSLRGMDIATLLADPTLHRVLSERIAAVVSPEGVEKPDSALVKLIETHNEQGSEALLEAFWDDLEIGDSLYCFQRVLDVRTWDAIGAALDLDAASLSRGALVRRTKSVVVENKNQIFSNYF